MPSFETVYAAITIRDDLKKLAEEMIGEEPDELLPLVEEIIVLAGRCRKLLNAKAERLP